MDALREFDTDRLLQSAADGDNQAAEMLLGRHRERLKSMIAIRLAPQLAARLDASDVVQDVLVLAHNSLAEYLSEKPIAFYPWLRKIAITRLTDLYRHHVQIQKRSTNREAASLAMLSDQSADQLVQGLAGKQTSPSQQFMNAELKKRLRDALSGLSETQREIIVMRHLEQLSVKEIAAILDIPEGSVMSRHYRGLRALRRILDG